MTELFVLAILWGGVLWYVAVTPKEKMQMVWLILVGLVLISPLIALVWPMFR